MSRLEELNSMTGRMLIAEADRLSVKVSCNNERTGLKESKSKVIDRIIETEKAMKKKYEKSTLSVEHDNNEIIAFLNDNNISYKCYNNKDIAILNDLGKCVARIFIQRKSMRVQTKTLNDFSMSLENSSFKNSSYSSGLKGRRRFSSGLNSMGTSVTMVASQ